MFKTVLTIFRGSVAAAGEELDEGVALPPLDLAAAVEEDEGPTEEGRGKRC